MLELLYDNDRFLSDENLPKTQKYITDALEYTFWETTYADLLFDICDSQLVLLGIVVDGEYIGCLTGKVVHYDQKTALRLVTMGGIQQQYWKEVAEKVTQYAKCLGCDTLEGWVRPDGVRAGKDIFGFKHQYSVMVKEV